LWQEGLLAESEAAKFITKSGSLVVKKNQKWVEMDFPRFESTPVKVPEELLQILNVNPIHTAEVFDRYLIEVATENEVKDINPDFSKLKHFKKVLITSKSDADSPFDFISRYFAPSIGVNEDPVTGSSHCCLGPYWSKKLNKNEFTAYQASKRGGIVRVRLEDNLVKLSGQAITTVKGSLVI